MSTLIDLGKLRFHFRGDYAAATQYEYNDVVGYGGDLFVYVNSVASIGNLPSNTTFWTKCVSALNSLGTWSAAANYEPNDLVKYGGSYYRCIAVSLNNEPPNATYWEEFIGGYNHRGAWASSTAYKVNDSVTYQGHTYRCLTVHTSTTSFYSDFVTNSRWARVTRGVANRGAYANATAYFQNDLVTTGIAPNLNLYLCLNDHTSVGANITDAGEISNWATLISGNYSVSTADRQYAYFVGIV